MIDVTRLADIREMWKIQEDLLQQYRGKAITMLGLIAAALMVLISLLISSWDEVEGVFLQLFCQGNLEMIDAFIFITLVIYAVLLFLGWQGNRKFKGICLARQKYVTFFQNLLIAEESGKLKDICSALAIPYPVKQNTILRHLESIKPPLSFERRIDRQNLARFIDTILQSGEKNQDDRVRHGATRNFLKSWIFSVYNFFFFLSTVQFFIVVLHALSATQ